MDYKTKFMNIFNQFFPRKGTGVLSQYSKTVLDNPVEIVYDGLSKYGIAADQTFIGKVVMLEPKSTLTVENIVSAVENKYPKTIVELATSLRDMKLQYSLHASAFSSKLFDAQDALGLTSEEVRTIIGHIIDQKDVIIETTQAAIDIIYKPK
jgi:hypothetical protein